MDETQPWGKTNLPSMSWGEEEQTVRGHMSSPSRRREEEGFRLRVVWPQCISGHPLKQGQLSCLVWSCQGGTPRTAKGGAQLLVRYQSKGPHWASQGAFHRKKKLNKIKKLKKETVGLVFEISCVATRTLVKEGSRVLAHPVHGQGEEGEKQTP